MCSIYLPNDLNQAWSGITYITFNIKEVNSQDSANGGDLHRCSPSFCYSMLALHGEAECSILKHSPDEVSVYSPPIYESLVQQITNPHKKLETEK